MLKRRRPKEGENGPFSTGFDLRSRPTRTVGWGPWSSGPDCGSTLPGGGCLGGLPTLIHKALWVLCNLVVQPGTIAWASASGYPIALRVQAGCEKVDT